MFVTVYERSVLILAAVGVVCTSLIAPVVLAQNAAEIQRIRQQQEQAEEGDQPDKLPGGMAVSQQCEMWDRSERGAGQDRIRLSSSSADRFVFTAIVVLAGDSLCWTVIDAELPALELEELASCWPHAPPRLT